MVAAALENKERRVNPKMFALWIAMVSMTMLFAAFTSAYIVRKAAGNWDEYRLPDVFAISTLVILISSIALQWSKVSLNRDNAFSYKFGLGLTLALGLLFVILQYTGWQDLASYGVYIDGNPSGSFLYVITGTHVVHVVGGIVILIFAFIDAILNYSGVVRSLVYETSPGKKFRMRLISTYWHFVGILWLYLYLFFYFNHL